MISSAFSSLDREATTTAFKEYLMEWKAWKLKAARRFPALGSPNMDGQPHGTTYEPDKQFINHADASYQWHERVNCCKVLKTISEEDEVLGDILYYRFIRGWSAAKVMMWVNDHYQLCLGDRDFRRLQEQALWEGALMCPNKSVRIEK